MFSVRFLYFIHTVNSLTIPNWCCTLNGFAQLNVKLNNVLNLEI